jgi:streptogramin lyase
MLATSLILFALASVGAPHVAGPRTTIAERPVYRFRAAHAIGFRCAFDSRHLHRCNARYSQPLGLGRHTLRVRAVGRGQALSRTVTVRVVVKSPYPSLAAGAPLAVGVGAGVPAVDPGGLWVPVTATGDLARVDPGGGSVTARVHVGLPPAGSGFLDSAVFAGGSVWAASDSGGTIARVDPTSGAVTGTIAVPPRPGGLAAGGGSVWAFHFQSSSVTQIDAATGAAHTLTVGDANATGIAYGGGALWLLTQLPSRVLRVDPSSGSVLQSIALSPPYARKHGLIETWWLAYGDGAVWATLPNYDAVARIDAATGSVRYARTPYGEPFGVAAGGGSAWVATDHGVLRLDATTGSPSGVALLPTASRTRFVSITYSSGAAWFTNYDRGTLTRVSG